jgi:pimeloyl-ACP methyl ester carboxylesterase
MTKPESTIAYSVSGTGENLLLVHGGTGSRKHWLRNTAALAEHYRVWAIDLPGFGESLELPAGLDSEQYIAYVYEQLQAFTFTQESFLLGAFSFGSVVSSGLALKFGERLKKISIIGPAGFGIKRAVPIDTRSMRSAGSSIEAQNEVMRHNLKAIMLYYPESITDEILAMHRVHINETRFDSRPLSLSPLLLANLKQVSCPLQILWGEHDQYAHPKLDERMQLTQQALPNARLAKIARAGHWAQYENAEDTNRAMLDFFKHSK